MINNVLKYFMRMTAPSTCINNNSSSFTNLQPQIKKPLQSLYSNLNGMSFVIKQLNSHLYSGYQSDKSSSDFDIRLALNLINQVYQSTKPFNNSLKNRHSKDTIQKNNFQILYENFIKRTTNFLNDIVFPDNIYLQIYASFAPSLCLYLKQMNKDEISISPEEFNIYVKLNEETIDSAIAFLAEDRYDILFEKLISQFSSITSQSSSKNLVHKKITAEIESISQFLTPQPQESGRYKEAICQIEQLKQDLNQYCEKSTMKSFSSIFVLISHVESQLRALRRGYLAKESLTSLLNFTSGNNWNVSVGSSEGIGKKFANRVIRLFIQEVKSLHIHNLIDNDFAQSLLSVLNLKSDFRDFLKNLPSHFETLKSSSDSDNYQLQNYDDCCSMFVKFSSDEGIKGSELHCNLMKNVIIGQSEVILNTCIQNTREGESADVNPIIPLIDDVISIINNLTTQKQSKIILTLLAHILKIVQLFCTTIKNPDDVQLLKDFLALNMPSFDSLDGILGIKQKIGDLLAMIKLYNVFQNEQCSPKSIEEIFDQREMKENFEITVIQKQRQIPEMILRQLDIIFPYKDFPSKYEELCDMFGGSVANDFSNFAFDQELFSISTSLLSLIFSSKENFELNGSFFVDWLKIIFSMFSANQDLKDQEIPKFSEIIPFFNFSFVFSKTILTFNITQVIASQQSKSIELDSGNNSANSRNLLVEQIESLRTLVFQFLKTMDVDISDLSYKIADLKEKAKKFLKGSYYRRIEDQLGLVQMNMIVVSGISHLTSLLSKKYPDEIFDCRPIFVTNAVLSMYEFLSAISSSRYLSDDYRSNFEALKTNADGIFDIIKQYKFYSPLLNNAIFELLIPFTSEVHQLIKKFDITSLLDTTSEYVYSILDFFDSKESVDSISPDTLVSILHLSFISEAISPNATIFQNMHSISSILYTLFNIKQHPLQLSELFEKLKETVMASFVNYGMFTMVNFIQHIFIERYDFMKIYQREKDFDLVDEDEEIENICDTNKFSQLFEVIPATVRDISELRPYVQRVVKEFKPQSKSNLDDFLKECNSLFEGIQTVISPFVEPNERLAEMKEMNKKLLDELRNEEEKRKNVIEETEKSFVKTRKNCHKVKSRIESAILEESKLSIAIEQKKKHLVELRSQIKNKEQEIALQNEKTPPETKQKQKMEFMGTIRALREIVGYTKNDPAEVEELTKKLAEVNAKNEKLIKAIENIERQHSTTREDEIELLMLTENSSFLPSSSQENVEKENEQLQKQIAELEESNEKIRKKLKRISSCINSQKNETLQTDDMPFISGPDKALVNFLHSTRPYNFSNSQVDYDSFTEFKNLTFKRINELMVKRQNLIDERDSTKKLEENP